MKNYPAFYAELRRQLGHLNRAAPKAMAGFSQAA